MSRWTRLILALVLRSLREPALGLDLLRVAWRFRRRAWHRRAPFVPLPDGEYLRWRMYTAYGDEQTVPPVEDIVRYAKWATR